MLRSSTIFLFIVLSLVSFAQKKKKQDKHEILFSVNGRDVKTSEFEYLYNKNNQNQSDQGQKQKVQEYLDLFVNFKLKVEEARQRGNDTTAAFLKEYNSYKQELRKPYLPEDHIVDSLVNLTYRRLQKEVRASHLLIRVVPNALPEDTITAYNKALGLLKRAKAGEDFVALVDTYSEDETARSNHGDVGYFTALQMVYPFEDAAYRGRKGEVVGPVRTRFGYHLIKITDHKAARGEVEVAHIMLRAASNDPSVRDRIFEVFDQVRGGVSWDELCKKYSEDQSTKDNGGKLRPFGVGAMRSVPQFEEAAFSLEKPGDVSDPFQTAYGWHIVKLVQKIPVPPLKEIEPSLRSRVMRDERVQMSRKSAAEKLRMQLGFKEYSSVKDQVFALADTTLTAGKWRQGSLKTLDKQILFSTSAHSTSAVDFVQFVLKYQQAVRLTPSQYMSQLYNEFVDNKINAEFDEKISRNNPEYGFLLKEYYEGILLFDIMEKEVWNKANNDSTGQKEFFEENLSKYTAGERIYGTIYSSTKKQTLENIKPFVGRKDHEKIEESLQSRNLRYETGSFQRGDRPALAKIDWKPGLYEVDDNGMYYLVQVEKMVPAGPLTFMEARPSIVSDYQEYLEKIWIEKLKKKYPVKINEASRKYVFEKLSH